MNLLGEYRNGNYNVSIFDDGTKIRETDDAVFVSQFPECMDVKITNYCDMNCPYCHENSTIEGQHGDILHPKFIDTLRPYTEIAIGGGNPLSHPQLLEFLTILKSKNIIANITVNQTHFLQEQDMLRHLYDDKLVRGLGVSLTSATPELIAQLKTFPNAVLHVINGVVSIGELRSLYNNGFKVLILGYKMFRKGNQFYSEEVEHNKAVLYTLLPEVVRGFAVVSFDNLAIDQLEVKRLMSQRQWDEFYMGDDGQFTMYIDLVEQRFARCSVATERFDLLDNIDDMFQVVKRSR